MSQKPPPKQFVKTPISGTKYTILVSSAKGGVGKSTVAVNLSFALQKLGLKIGILDADVYGPSLPKLLNLREKPKSEDNKSIVPLKIDGVVIVSTPQDLALLDVKRGIQMFEKTGVKILGLLDNMSFFKGDDGKEYKIFGEGGVEKTAKEFNKEFLGHIPLNEDLRVSADKGEPLTYAQPNHEISKLFLSIAKKIKQSFH